MFVLRGTRARTTGFPVVPRYDPLTSRLITERLVHSHSSFP